MFYPHEGYRSVTHLDAARVNRTIFHNHLASGVLPGTWYWYPLARTYNAYYQASLQYHTTSDAEVHDDILV